MTVGEMNYNLSLLLEKNNLEVTQQPYDLQMAEADSKLVLSMSLNVSNRKFYIYIYICTEFNASRHNNHTKQFVFIDLEV